ncbi:MAG TPA: hypothetical protein VHW00_16955 [Thermoanaerobaculia bacterium]|nr:hypothetical protein [Thermoanaerobaculia bacterium]
MATSVEIIFVGLCSILNPRDQIANMPPPSAIIMRRTNHETFIAFDSNTVTVTGVTATPISGSRFSKIDFLADGEELTFNDDRTKLPSVDNSFDDVARFKTYSRIASPAWDPNFIPLRGKVPKKGVVAAYVEFGGGTLSAARKTAVLYQFALNGEALEVSKASCFAREVHYTFTSTGDGLLIEARSLDDGSKRSMLFKPKGGSSRVEVWIGNSMDPLGDLLRLEPAKYGEGVHFGTFYESETRADNVATDPIPRPLKYNCAGVPLPVSEGEGDPEIGYCGPDTRP